MTNNQLMQAAQMVLTRQNITAGGPAIPQVSNIQSRVIQLVKVTCTGDTIPPIEPPVSGHAYTDEPVIAMIGAVGGTIPVVASFIASGAAVIKHQ